MFHGKLNIAKDCRETTGSLKAAEHHKRHHHNRKANGSIKASRQPQTHRNQTHRNACCFGNDHLQNRKTQCLKFKRQSLIPAIVNGSRKLSFRIIDKRKRTNHADTANVLKNGTDKFCVGFRKLTCGRTYISLQKLHAHTKKNQRESAYNAKTYVQEEQEYDNNAGKREATHNGHVQKTAEVLHDIQLIGHDGRYFAKAILVKVPHGQMTQRISHFCSLPTGHAKVGVAKILALKMGAHKRPCNAYEHNP